MRKILGYIKNYWTGLDKPLFVAASLFIAIAVFINYYWSLNQSIIRLPYAGQFVAWYFIFLLAFGGGYVLTAVFKRSNIFQYSTALCLMLIAPAIFSWKMTSTFELDLAADEIMNAYWNRVLYWPFKLMVILTALFFIWKATRDQRESFYGLTLKAFEGRPYLIMLLIMVPLVAAASTQPDFLGTYPKLQHIAFLRNEEDSGWYKLLFELSYGSDFLGIEVFFRGFLTLCLARWVGRDAILPMAMFYCTIHFGKPLGECISSFFGGLILGTVTLHTRSVVGGLLVHLGIAWMMEIGGYLGNLYQ